MGPIFAVIVVDCCGVEKSCCSVLILLYSGNIELRSESKEVSVKFKIDSFSVRIKSVSKELACLLNARNEAAFIGTLVNFDFGLVET